MAWRFICVWEGGVCVFLEGGRYLGLFIEARIGRVFLWGSGFDAVEIRENVCFAVIGTYKKDVYVK